MFALYGRYAEDLSVLNDALRQRPRSVGILLLKGEALLKLGRTDEALEVAKLVQGRRPDDTSVSALLAQVDYALENYADAERLAQKATARLSHDELTNTKSGSIRLTLLAAAGRLHDVATARAALADLQNDLPALTSVAAVRQWISPQAALQNYESLYTGLELAGLKEQ